MGGNAFKKTKVSRISLEVYNQLKKFIFEALSPHIRLEYLFDKPEKIDFGDLDILYQDVEDLIIHDLITAVFNPVEIVTSGNVTSFAYNFIDTDVYYQVDLIRCESIEASKFYFSYGDLGGIIGRITKYYNIKFGEMGLFLDVFAETLQEYTESGEFKESGGSASSSKIILTSDPRAICAFLGLDYDRWGTFTTVVEIFEWISRCYWFDKTVFMSLNHEHKMRTIHRPMYAQFIKWLGIDVHNTANRPVTPHINKQLEAIKYYNKTHELDDLIEKHRVMVRRKAKFNGKKMDGLGLSMTALGSCIAAFKKSIVDVNGIEFNDWLDSHDEEYVDEHVRIFVESYKGISAG